MAVICTLLYFLIQLFSYPAASVFNKLRLRSRPIIILLETCTVRHLECVFRVNQIKYI